MRIKIGTKLTVGFMLLLSVVVALASYAVSITQKSLKESVGNSSIFLAEEILNRIEQNIYLKVEELQKYAKGYLLEKTLLESNREFEKLTSIEEYINRKSREWIAASKDEITPFMKGLISNELSNHLREEFIQFYEEKYGYKVFEVVFVSNKYGANVAQTEKRTDYRQDDEEWWQVAKERGFYAGDAEYDERAETHGIEIAVRIDDKEGNFIGTMKALVGAKEIIREAEIATKKHETTETKLITKNGKLIYATRTFKFSEDVSGKEFFKKIKGGSGSFIAKEGGRESLFSYVHSKGYRGLEGHGWIFVVAHDTGDVLRPALALRNSIVAASLILIALGILIAFFTTRSITKPIAELSRDAEIIGRGDLEHRVELKTRDEIGDLATAFNEMTENLKKTTASRDELNKEITERKRAEERLEHLNSVLRAIRSVNQLIAKEKDRDRLLQGSCDSLLETRGYFSAWIALLDNSGKLLTTAESGLKEAFLPLVELMKRGELPVCGSRALKGSEVVAIEDPSATCTTCPLALEYAGRGSMTVRLEHGGKAYGMMAVSMPREMVADQQEQALLHEVAGDFAFALHSIELEEERKRVEEELAKHHEHLEELVRERTDELQKTVNLMAGREVRMAELKETIRKLREQVESAGLTPVADDPLKEAGRVERED